MNVKKIVKALEKKYPGKNIVRNPQDNPTEILCEIEPSSEHPERSLAIAVIDNIQPHYHKETEEVYEVTKGILNLFVDNKKYVLKVGDSFTIKPGLVHWAKGDETWFKVSSKPGWIFEDHILVNKNG